jgi:CRISPR-associated protein Cas4
MDDDDPLPLSALQHAVYCLRQAALIHVERLWEENRFTAEGHVLHARVDEKGARYSRGVRRVSALPLACRRLGIAGVADFVEFHKGSDGETPYPVEYKRGKAKLHRADEAQLCAQALCLEEMTGRATKICRRVPCGRMDQGSSGMVSVSISYRSRPERGGEFALKLGLSGALERPALFRNTLQRFGFEVGYNFSHELFLTAVQSGENGKNRMGYAEKMQNACVRAA